MTVRRMFIVGDEIKDLDGDEGIIVEDSSNQYAESYRVKYKGGVIQCSAAFLFLKKQSVGESLARYKGLLDLSDSTQKSNLKFVESYSAHAKKRMPEEWEIEVRWFIREAIRLHMSTFGKRKVSA